VCKTIADHTKKMSVTIQLGEVVAVGIGLGFVIRAIRYQNPQRDAELLKAVHEARVKIVPKV
jgi:hypothetical protein